jgi:predicted alpha/beta superfamily hydrolase
MKNLVISLIIWLMYMNLYAQDRVTIGRYRNFTSTILGGEVTYLEHLPDGYEKSDKTYPVVFMMYGQNISQFPQSFTGHSAICWQL